MQEYRLKETNPYTFEIEVKKVYFKGFLWWRKRVEEWNPVDVDGRVFDGKFPRLLPIKYRDYALLQLKKFRGELHPQKQYLIHD